MATRAGPAVLPAAGLSPALHHGAFGVSSGSFSCCTHRGPWTGCICRNPTALTCTDRTFPFFPSTPWCCLLTGHQAAHAGRQGVISAAVLLPPALVAGTALATRLLPPGHLYSGSSRGPMPVFSPNSVPVVAMSSVPELAMPEFWGLQSTDRMRGFAVPSQPMQAIIFCILG